jgi:hypothetical protein
MRQRPSKRREERKFKRVEIRYGPEKPVHRAMAIQLSSTGAFIAARRPVFAAGSRIVIEFKTPKGLLTLQAMIRHAKNLPPQIAHLAKTGMGVEFISPPRELEEFLSSL